MIDSKLEEFIEENYEHPIEVLIEIVKLLKWEIVVVNDEDEYVHGLIIGTDEYVDKVMTLWNKLANNKAMRKTIGLPIYLAKVREFVLGENKIYIRKAVGEK